MSTEASRVDPAVWRLLAGPALPHTPAAVRGIIYRHFDANRRLLYVGSTGSLRYRTRQVVHSRTARWWRYVDRISHAQTSDRATAYELEKLAIRTEDPIFNRILNARDQRAREARYEQSNPHVLATWAGAPVGEASWIRRDKVDAMLRELGVHEATAARWAKPPTEDRRRRRPAP